MKRLLSMILVLTLLVGMVPVPAKANEVSTQMADNDVTIQGSNGFGNLLSEDLQTEYAEETEDTGAYGVTDLTIAGNTAVVEYHTIEEAILVVAIYTEDKLQMITSGKTEVSPDFTETTVTIAGTMPEYFHASAYLVDTYDYSPLCQAYDTPMYTRAMQDLLDATVDDFDPDRVLNLDDDKTTNFAVYAEDTTVLEAQPGVNTVASVDDEAMTYVIENADENIRNLKPGEVFAYPYGDNNILIVKVASVRMDGTTATIQGTELDMEDVFSHVKVEADGNAGDVTVDESTGDGITYTGMSNEGSAYGLRDRAWEGEGSGGLKLNFELYKREYHSDDKKGSVEVEGSLSLNFTVKFSYYVSLETYFITFDLDNKITLQGEIKGKYKGEIAKFPSFGFEPIPCVFIGFEPALVLEFEGTFTIGVSYTDGTSFHFEKGQAVKRYAKKPALDFNLEAEGKIFFGIDMGPHVAILRGAVLELKLSALGGAEVNAKLTGKLHLLGEQERGASIHDCNACISADLTAKVEFSLKMTFLKMKKLTFSFKLAVLKYEIGSLYLSLDNWEFGWGSCPYVRYQTIYIVKDEGGKVLPDQIVFNSNGDTLGTTDKNGQVIEYLPAGVYDVATKIGETEISKRFEVTKKAQRIVLRAGSGDRLEYGIFGTIDTISITNFGAVIAGGNCGTPIPENVTWTLYENGALILVGDGAFSVPDENSWKKHKDAIQYIAVCDGITAIPYQAFFDLPSVVEVVVADSVQSWGTGCFALCTGLKEVTLPVDYATSLSCAPFDGCSSVEYIHYTPGATGIMADRNNQNNYSTYAYVLTMEYDSRNTLKRVDFDEGVKHIGANAFYGCSFLEEVNLPSTLESIGASAFYGNGSLSTVNLPHGLTQLGDSAFSGCISLSDITLPNTLTAISYEAFYNCTSLTEMVIPDSVTSIGARAFHSCSGIQTLHIPDGVQSWDAGCFALCTGLKEVTLPVDYATSLSCAPFDGCSSVEYIHYTPGATGIMADRNNQNNYSTYAYELTMEYDSRNTLKRVDFDEGVKHIGANAFYGCSFLEEANLPSTLESIGASAFYGNGSLSTVNLPHGLTQLGDSAFSGCISLSDITLPNTLTAISYEAFYNCTSLTEMVIPDSVTSIGTRTFWGCSGIQTLHIPDSVQSWGDRCFANCTGLKEVTLPVDYATSMSCAPFDGCSSVEYIHYTPGATGIMVDRNTSNNYSTYAYELTMEYDSRNTLKRVDFDEGVKHIGVNAFYVCSFLEEANLPSTLESIGASAFYGNGSLSTVNLPHGLTQLGDSAFKNCISLSDITLPNTLAAISYEAFYNCTSLTEMVIPDSVTSIGTRTFWGCSGIQTLHIPDSVQSWGDRCFALCTELKEVTLPVDYATSMSCAPFDGCSSVEYIHYTPGATGIMVDRNTSNNYSTYAYELTMEYDSRNTLKRVDFDEGVKHIGVNAFYGCSFLEEVNLPSTLESIGSNAFYNVTADMYYHADSETWTEEMLQNYGGNLTWYPYEVEETDLTERIEPDEEVAGLVEEILPESTEETIPEETVPGTATEPTVPETVPDTTIPETEPVIPETEPEETLPETTAPEANVPESIETEPMPVETMPQDVEPCRIEDLLNPEDILQPEPLSVTTPEYQLIPLSQTTAETTTTAESSVSVPASKALNGGSYSDEETEDGLQVKVATFRNLLPGGQYVLLVLKDLQCQDPLSPDNLLYIDQKAAGEDGTLQFRYIPRETQLVTYVTACGPSSQSLSDAVITIPEMTSNGATQTIEPVVKYQGKTLVENQDYTLLGQLSAVDPGEYTFYIRGIHNYSGLLECKFTILRHKGDLNGDGVPTADDVVYLIWHTLFPEMYPLDSMQADYNNDGAVTDADAILLLWHILFQDRYPL